MWIEDQRWHKPWNYELEQNLDKDEKKKIKEQAWAEQAHTINEVGSTYTIQGFDLNYAGVILGKSVKYRDGKIVYDPSESSNGKATKKRTMEDGTKQNFAKELLKAAWAVVVFIMITAQKIKTSGFGGYLKGFTQPIPVMTPFNILSELATPVSMACRHFGNILSGVVINGLIYGALAVASSALLGLIPGLVGDVLSQIPVLDVGVPAILSVYFDWFSGIMQAFIFCMLTVMYIANAAEEG